MTVPLVLRPDWSAVGDPFRHTWEGIVNVDQFRWMVRRDMQEQLQLAHDELGARHVRAVGMFDDEMRVFGRDPQDFNKPRPHSLRTNWQVVDYVIDSLRSLGLSPMFTTSFVPSAMASGTATVFTTKGCVSPPNDLSQWADLVSEGIRHMIDRYGSEIVRNWYCEVWNEPNLRGFWDGDQAQFHALWAATYRALKRVDPKLKVGGPSTARAEWVADLLDFGRKNDCVPDYFITHIYNNDSESAPLSPFEGAQTDRTSKSPHFAAGVIRGTRKVLSDAGFHGELHFNEWGRSWWACFPDRESANEAAFIVKTMAEVSQCADRFAYWCLSDIYDQVGYGRETFHGNYGLLNLHGLRKPSYHAFQLLSKLGTQRVPVKGLETNPLMHGIATCGPNSCQLLLSRYAESESYTPQAMPLRVALPKNLKTPQVMAWRIGAKDNNIVNTWRQQGAHPYLKPEQIQELRTINGLTPSGESLPTSRQDEALFIDTTLECPGVLLLEILSG